MFFFSGYCPLWQKSGYGSAKHHLARGGSTGLSGSCTQIEECMLDVTAILEGFSDDVFPVFDMTFDEPVTLWVVWGTSDMCNSPDLREYSEGFSSVLWPVVRHYFFRSAE